jgi:hypothetical protein
MNYFVKVDAADVVWGSTFSDEAPDPTWVPVDFDPSEAMLLPTKQRLVNGALVDTGQPIFPPEPWLVWDTATIAWVDPRDLQQIKDAKWAEIKVARTEQEYGGFVWDGSPFDSDALSQQRIIGASQWAGMNSSFTIDWTLADNTVRILNAQEMMAVGGALGIHVEQAFTKGRDLRTLIDNAQTIAEVEAIHW